MHMRWFVIGFAMPLAGICAYNTDGLRWDWDVLAPSGILAVILCIGPAVGAWATTTIIDARSPRRVFHTSGGDLFPPCATGFVCGAGTVALLFVLLEFSTSLWSDAALIELSAVVSTAIVIGFASRRVVRGACRRCGYDVRASLSIGRCPECGETLDFRLERRAA